MSRGRTPGYKHSEETLKKMSERRRARKGHSCHPMLGRKQSKEAKLKISIARIGKKLSPETRIKISESMRGKRNCLGRKLTPEHKENIAAAHRGPKSHLWRGGKTELSQIIRTCFLYITWRNRVYARDKYTCIECGDNRGKNLEADHIYPLWKIIRDNKIDKFEDAIKCEILWDISNGRTLCETCHKKTDTWGRKKLN